MNNNQITSWIRRRSFGASVVLMLAPLASCNSLVDSPNTAKPAEQDVRTYYVKMDQPNVQYRYAVKSKNCYQPPEDILVMDMQGRDGKDLWMGSPIYDCNWSYVKAGSPVMWYYALDDKQAVDLGVEYLGQYTDSWVDLQSPLAPNASWTFTSKGERITATVKAYGVSASVSGKTYDDVVMVTYTGTLGTTGTGWYARGVGAIFYHIERPGDVMLDEQYQSMKQ